MKIITKALSLVLALSLIFGCVSVFAGAQDKLNYVVIGDSIAAGSGLKSPETNAYGAIVANTNGYGYINHAVPGYTTQNLLDLLKKDEVRNDIANADIISISIGGNDFLLGGLVKLIFDAVIRKDYSMFDEIAAKLFTNFSAIMAEIKKLNPNATILMQTLYNPRYDFLRGAYQQAADRINATFARYLTENPGSFVLVDVAKALEGHEEWVAVDKIHPNADGHVEIAKLLLKTLKDLELGESLVPVIADSGDPVKQDILEIIRIGIKNVLITLKGLIKLPVLK